MTELIEWRGRMRTKEQIRELEELRGAVIQEYENSDRYVRDWELALSSIEIKAEFAAKFDGKQTTKCPFCGKRTGANTGFHNDCWNDATYDNRMKVNKIWNEVVA